MVNLGKHKRGEDDRPGVLQHQPAGGEVLRVAVGRGD
jgi:hypothetical protein